MADSKQVTPAKAATPAAKPQAKADETVKPVAASGSEAAPKIPAPAAKVVAPAAKVVAPAAKVEAPAVKVEAPVAKVAVPATPVPAPAAKVAAPVAKKTPARVAAPAKPKQTVVKAAAPKPARKPAVIKTEIEPKAAKLAALKEGNVKMVDTVKNTADKAQAMFTDMSDRSKAAMEKGSKFVEEVVEFTKGNVEALMTSSRVAAKGTEELVREAAEFGRARFENATTTMKSFASAKSPTEVFQLQSDYAKGAFDSLVAESSKLSEAWLKLANDVFEPISSRYAVAADKIKKVAA